MSTKARLKNISEVTLKGGYKESIRNKIDVVTLTKSGVKELFCSPTHLNALTVVLVLSGNGEIEINHKPYSIKTNSLLLLSVSHLLKFVEYSPNFQAITLLVGHEFMYDMDSTDMIYKRIKYGAKLFSTPILELDSDNGELIHSRINTINRAIANRDHLYHKEVILNRLLAFYLDLGYMIEKNKKAINKSNAIRYESLIKGFIELLTANYREEHKVEFYAAKLNITPHYLTLIVKRVTGQTASDFIFEMLYSEARNLLSHSKLSIQEITAKLHFADQSSFGKFFKRKSTLSPIEFRKRDN